MNIKGTNGNDPPHIDPKRQPDSNATDDLFASIGDEGLETIFSQKGSLANQGNAFNAQDALAAFKTQQGPIDGPQHFLEIYNSFGYQNKPSELLANTDSTLEYLATFLSPNPPRVNYENPSSKPASETKEQIIELARKNGLQVINSNDNNLDSKSVMVFISDTHDQKSEHKKQAAFLNDLYSYLKAL